VTHDTCHVFKIPIKTMFSEGDRVALWMNVFDRHQAKHCFTYEIEGYLGTCETTNTLKIMSLPDEMLVRLIRTVPVSLDMISFVTNLKATHSYLYQLLQSEMRLDKAHHISIQDLFFLHHVHGTRIPCNTENVLALPEPERASELVQLLESASPSLSKNKSQQNSEVYTRRGHSSPDSLTSTGGV